MLDLDWFYQDSEAQEIMHSLSIEEAEISGKIIFIGSGEDNHIVMFPEKYKEVK
jgi:hypothetical protein